MVSAVTLLPQPDSPTTPSVCPRLSENDDAVHGLDQAVHDVEVRAQVAHVEQHVEVARRHGPCVSITVGASATYSRLRGSSASRSPSPMKLMAMTVRAMAMPGKNAHHQLPRISARLGVGERRCPS